MSIPSDSSSEAFEPQKVAPAATLPTRPFYWSVQREIWEHRSLYIAPFAVAALFLFGFMISLIHLPAHMRSAGINPEQHDFLDRADSFAALLLMATTLIIAGFYCLDALHGERRDRSILFWKSLPVSDLTIVLSKAVIPILLLPLLTFILTVALWILMLVLSNIVLSARGLHMAAPHVSFSDMSLGLFYHLMAIHGLFYAPFYGWMLMISAWARRAAFLWAVLPVVAIGMVEKIAFNTSYFASMLGDRLGGGIDAADKATAASATLMTHFTPGHFLSDRSFWTGLVVTTGFLAAAVYLRRNREPI